MKNILFSENQTRKKSSYILYGIILIFILAIFLDTINCFDISYLKKPSMFMDEICSYNGKGKAINDNNVVCECNKEYANDPNEKGTINGVPIQCSYFKKRKFITVFFSIFLPLGIEYFYLEHYAYFVIIIICCCTAIIGNCIRFTISTSQEKYFKNKVNLFFTLLLVAMVIFYIANVILMFIGVKDGNNVEVLNDLYLLVNIQSEQN